MRRFSVLILCCACLISSARSETYVVNPDGSGDFPTIQAAVDACHTGDTVLLGNGTFRGEGNRDIRVYVEISIRSQWSDPSMCTIDCEGSPADPHYGFWISQTWEHRSELAGITIRNVHDSRGAVCCYGCYSTTMIHDCIFVECMGDLGGAVHCDGSDNVILERCAFIRNTAEYGGGAFGSCFSSGSVLRECTFWGNGAGRGGGALYI